ncbi:hypothetical protein [Nocardioides daphniae]|uniref:hypothetical protein n=1 Tax=Nocardioides daphniae TaxID=402297 RepID=UPI0023B16055|nr:hypothetical protein [Nocardioides daphniae]
MADGAAAGDLADRGRHQAHHLTDAVAAVELEFTADELEELGAAYEPHRIAGHGPATVHASR